MSRRDVIGEAGEQPNENNNLVELHSQNAQQIESQIKEKQEHNPSDKTKQHSISTYLAIFQWILLIFCVVSNLYLLTKPSVQCDCDGSSAQSKKISTNPTTNSPTTHPTTAPITSYPSGHPSTDPTAFPSLQPSSSDQTETPSRHPSSDPTISPSSDPSFDPTVAPTRAPSSDPSNEPTKQPTRRPSFDPSAIPTKQPTRVPSSDPSMGPSLAPSDYPSQAPTYFDGYFVGDYKYSFRNESHGFWLLCHGQWLDKDQYPSLFDVMRYQFGTFHDTATDILYFRVPDARDTVMGVIGSTHRMGHRIGNETYKLSESEMPEHVHYFVGDVSPACESASCKYVRRIDTQSRNYDYALLRTNVFETEFETSVGGSNQSFSLMQPTRFIGHLFVYSGQIHS